MSNIIVPSNILGNESLRNYNVSELSYDGIYLLKIAPVFDGYSKVKGFKIHIHSQVEHFIEYFETIFPFDNWKDETMMKLIKYIDDRYNFKLALL